MKLSDLKKNKGITLIALVITIIVLLILAGIAISMLTGDNSILKQAGNAKIRTEEATAKELQTLLANDWETEKYTNSNANIETYLSDQKTKNNIDDYEDLGDGLYLIKKGNQEITLDDGNVYTWDGSASTELKGSGTEDDPFLIRSGKDLKFLSDAIKDKIKYTDKNNEERLYKFACFKQVKDISLNDTSNFENWSKDSFDKSTLHEFTPIAFESFFSGLYNGNGHTISGLYINQPNSTYVGLFSELYTTTDENYKIVDCCVKDLNITNALLIGKNVGTLTRRLTSSTISNCNCSGKIISNHEWSNYCGGIVGSAGYYGSNQSKILGCKSSVTIESTGSFIGGILGYTWSEATIENCKNTGNIIGKQSVGGIGGQVAKATIKNCINTGNIYNCAGVTYLYYFGGIIGQTDENARIEGCNNSGNITINGEENVEYSILDMGGISGRSYRTTISNSNNSGNITINAKLKLNESSSRGFGGVLGEGGSSDSNKPAIINCTNTGTIKMNVNSVSTVGDIIGEGTYKTSE